MPSMRRLVITIAVLVVLIHWFALALLLVGGGDIGAGIWALSRASGVAAGEPTPTPTKTPAPLRVRPTPTAPVVVNISLPTPTPTPATTVAPPEPGSTPTLPTPPAEVVAAAASRGIDTSGRYIVVNQAEQRMYVVDGPVLERVLPVSTGDPEQGTFTPPWVGRVGAYWGTFSAHGVSADNAWHLFKTPAGNILIHGVPYTVDAGGRKIYQDLDKLGIAPASRGCIRLRPEDAVWFTEWDPQGVPIVILPYPAQR